MLWLRIYFCRECCDYAFFCRNYAFFLPPMSRLCAFWGRSVGFYSEFWQKFWEKLWRLEPLPCNVLLERIGAITLVHFFGKTWQSCEEPCHQKFRTHRLTKGMGSCYRMAKWTMSTYLGASRRQSITASFEQSWQGQGWSHSSHSETKSPLLTPTCWNSFQSLEN